MKKKNYSQLNYEQELARKERAEKKAAKAGKSELPEKEPPYGFWRCVLLPNIPNLLLNNLWFVLFSLPALFCLGAFLMVGGLIFILGLLLSMALVGPAMASLYHRCYEYTRQVPKLVREPFMTFFRREFRQGAACGLVLGILWILLAFYSLVGQSQTETQPAVYYTIVFLCLFLVSYYTITVMAQVSQFDLPTKAILKNGVILLAACGWHGVVPALLQTAYVLIAVAWPSTGLLLFFLAVPGIIFAAATHLLWPRLSQILLTSQE